MQFHFIYLYRYVPIYLICRIHQVFTQIWCTQINWKSLSKLAQNLLQMCRLTVRDAHFSGFEFLVEKREKWSISRREKSEKSRKIWKNYNLSLIPEASHSKAKFREINWMTMIILFNEIQMHLKNISWNQLNCKTLNPLSKIPWNQTFCFPYSLPYLKVISWNIFPNWFHVKNVKKNESILKSYLWIVICT